MLEACEAIGLPRLTKVPVTNRPNWGQPRALEEAENETLPPFCGSHRGRREVQTDSDYGTSEND